MAVFCVEIPFFSSLLKLEEDLALIEPVAEIPHDEQNGAGLGDRTEVAEEGIVGSEDTHGPAEPAAKDLVQRVNENRIGTDDEKGEGPFAPALDFDDPVESQEHQQDPAATVEGEGGRACALDDRIPRAR